ncbi:GmrSD restriction endonuclease domain-containing protein [Streptomyces griseoluteus]|uniref:GmrSD restriction endonuclease domain-containing protein n=1 Tax=Streptomyces griseoluteus TaxID=29306 RepID=UPI0036FEC459
MAGGTTGNGSASGALDLDATFPPPRNQQVRFEFTDTGINADIEAEDVGEAHQIEFDPELIDVQPRSTTVDLVIKRLSRGQIDLQPDFQRHSGVWNERSQSRLIESLLLRIALPTIYVAQEDDDSWSVVDGVQRLSTIVRFVQPEAAGLQRLYLSDLEYLTRYNGCQFEDLPGRMQTRIAETELSLLVIRKGTPEEAKFNIFARINTGGQPLSRQELRHALIPGPARKLLAELAGSEAFLEATTRSVSPTRMAERELCLRFLAFWLKPPERYTTQDFDGFLRNAMHSINRLSPEEQGVLVDGFEYAMSACRQVFGRHAFRKQVRGASFRYPINKALFEVQSVVLAQCEPEMIDELAVRAEFVRDKFMNLVDEPEFFDSISSGTGDADKVNYRFQSMKDLIREVLHA